MLRYYITLFLRRQLLTKTYVDHMFLKRIQSTPQYQRTALRQKQVVFPCFRLPVCSYEIRSKLTRALTLIHVILNLIQTLVFHPSLNPSGEFLDNLSSLFPSLTLY